MGPVQKIPESGIRQLIGQIPYVGAVQKILPRNTLPANDPRMVKARQIYEADKNLFQNFVNRFTGN
jgi:hypothetical protein